MKARVSMIIMSHLSDVQELIPGDERRANSRINFVKWLVMEFPDTKVEIDPDVEYQRFLSKFPKWEL